MTRRTPALTREMKASVKGMCGAALLWFSLSALVYVPTSGGGPKAIIVACLGFAAFCAGIGCLTARRD